jgi:hypothetical protein
MCVFPNPKLCDRRALPTQGTSTFHRRDRLFRICRHCRAQVGEVPRHFRIERYVALTKLASTDRSEPIAAATWAPASSGLNSCPRLQVEGPAQCPLWVPGLTVGSQLAPQDGRYDLSFPKIISGRIGDAVQPRSEWRRWLLDATAHLSVMPSVCAFDCNTPHTKQELVAGAAHQRPAFGPGTRDVMCRSDVLHNHFATAIRARSAGREYPWPSPGT